MVDDDNRNTIMGLVAILATIYLIGGAMGSALLLSYASVFFILAVGVVPTIEQHDNEMDIAPYGGIIAVWAVLFLVGITGIWMTWNPGMAAEEYTYVLGLPLPTAIYLAFLWFLPFAVPVYYALNVFEKTVEQETIDTIIDDARSAQKDGDYDLLPTEVEEGDD